MTPAELRRILNANPDLTLQEWANSQASGTVPPVTVPGATEHDEQVAVFAWIDANVDRYPALRCAFAVPNGGKRDAATAGKLKAEGCRAGVPDIFLACPRAHYGDNHAGLFIELKVGKNKATEKQSEWIERLRLYGYMAVVCYGAADAIATIKHYLEIDE